jgi:multiple sugar transport system permease protein
MVTKKDLFYISRKNIRILGLYFALFLIAIESLFPVVWMFITSIKHPLDVYIVPPKVLFKPVFDNYLKVFNETNFMLNLKNSIIASTLSTIVCILIGASAAYSMARFRTGGAYGPTMIIMLRVMPPIVLIIPIYVLYRAVGLYGRIEGLILLYSVFNLPIAILMMLTFFTRMPKEIEEAAYLDGCDELQTYIRIILPNSLHGLIATAAFIFIMCWNEFLFAVILTSESTKTAPVALFGFITHLGIPVGPVSAIGILLILPVMLLFFILQAYIVQGLTAPYIQKL